MCGIAGVYRQDGPPPEGAARAADAALVGSMLRAIEYRGPDDHGIEQAGRLTFGTRRLSILDVEGGHQPLCDADGRVWAAQNGEIYNFPELREDLARRHLLRTRTDTELLPYLYLEHGAAAFERLRGMFACAVCDTRDDSLWLARDPLGVKPLYVARHAGRVAFASELKALLCDPDLPRELDHDALAAYLALGFIPGEATPFRAIRKLRPGCRIRFTPRGESLERYWTWPRWFEPADGRAVSPGEAEREVERLLADSVRAMLLSDRPLGILLSGGVDSSVLAALLPEEIRRETLTFAIGFAGGGYHDERAHAQRVAGHLGTRHHAFEVSMDVAGELPRVIAFLDEPCADPAAVPAHLVARAASEHVTVLLSGTGGDEVFGGYRRYRMGALLRKLSWLPRGAAARGAAWLGDRDMHRRTLGGERLVMLRKLLDARGRRDFFAAYLSAFEPAPPSRWSAALRVPLDPARVAGPLWAALTAELGRVPGCDEEAAFAADHLYYLPDDLLLKEDRTTMGASVEGRVPFLDDGLVRYAAGLPLATRMGDPGGKGLLRRIAARHLPPDIAARRKHGFSVPIEDWLRGPLAPLARDLFAGEGSGVFDTAVLRRWLDEHAARRDRSGPLWAALSFELWWRAIGGARPAELEALGRPLRAVAGTAR